MPDTRWRVEPAGPLRGSVTIAGSKNAATKLMVAALLADSPSEIANTPRVGDVDITAAMLRSLGAGVEVGDGSVTIDPTTVSDSRVPVSYSGINRIPILLVGPLLHRLGEAVVPLSGGDLIGSRPVDFHLGALRAFGAEVAVTADGLHAKTVGLRGARIRLPFPSVGATETVLLTAALAKGRSVLENAAIEPEIIELALFLQRLGVGIELRTDRRFVIEGMPRLSGARQRLGGDRIEAFSYLVAGLATGGEVRIEGCAQDRLVTAIATLHRMGAALDVTDEAISARLPADARPVAVATSTHPGFMTDWQAPLVVLFTQVPGMSVLHETVFEDRLGYVEALRTMGAQAELFDQCLAGQACRFYEGDFLHSVVVRGRTPLLGAELTMPDIRAGFAYLLAAATASGPSVIGGVHHLERGYDRVFTKFAELGLGLTALP